MTDAVLTARGVRAAYGRTEVLRGVDWGLHAGELWAVLGPNGAGKSTLLRACLGLHPRIGGEVSLEGRALERYSRQELARVVAWVPQSGEGGEDFTGLELVMMGRSPHRGWWGLPSAADAVQARAAMDELGIGYLSDRRADEASGGERRLLLLARALVQKPRLLALDEPTAFLDLRHQVELLQRVKARVREGLAAVAVLHDVNLAGAFADKVLLIKDGRALAAGPTGEVLGQERLEQLFGIPMARAAAEGGQPLFAPRLSS